MVSRRLRARRAPEETRPTASLPVVPPDLVRHYRNRLLRQANLDELVNLPPDVRQVRIETLIGRMIVEEGRPLSLDERRALVQGILDETIGYGPLEALMKDPAVTEIMVNAPAEVYIERYGRLERTDVSFANEDHVRHIIDRIVAPLGRRIDESSPMVDARLPDGSRVNAVIPPVSPDGPVVTIRRFRKVPLSVGELVENYTLTPEMMAFLEACVRAKLNLIVSGGTSSGKTTTLNVLSTCIPEGERIVTIEDAAELRLRQPHVVRLEARPPNIEGKGEIAIRELVRNALRMRPDRIIVGEVRGAEALDMLQAMNTGHEGSLTTVHANSPRDCFSRLETMVMTGGVDLPLEAIREQIIGALNIVLQQNRLVDGSRRIVAISEIQGVEAGHIRLQDIFRFAQEGLSPQGRVLGQFRATGAVPLALERMRAFGIALPDSTFDPERKRPV